MKCLVTGGAGFIGSHLVDALVQRGDSVRVLDNLVTGDRKNLAAAWERIEFISGDIREPRDIERALAGIEVVFHQAALRSVERSVHDPLSTHQTNATGTLLLLETARRAGLKRVVYASSSSAYGDARAFPQSETQRPSPLSPYAVSKLSGEMYCGVYARTFGLETVALRYFNVFGPRQQPESQYAAVIPQFMQAALAGTPLEVHGDGRQSRDFTYVENVVQANLRAASAPKAAGEFFNVACGRNQSLLAIIRELEKLSGKTLERRHAPRRAGDVRKTWADIRKARRLLGYAPTVDLKKGLHQTWDWFVQTHAPGAR